MESVSSDELATPDRGGTVLSALTAPRSIAIIGASDDPDKLSGRPVAGLLESGYPGRVVCVNPARSRVQGLPCFDSLRAVDEPVDLAVLTVPAHRVLAALTDCAAAGVTVAVVFASGFAETDGSDAQRRIGELARRSGMRVLGPNCIGAIALRHGVVASFSRALHGVPVSLGPVALVSQSGAFGSLVLSAAQQAGIGFHSFVSTGNEADLSVPEVLGALAEDPDVGTLLMYTEGLSDGDALLRAARRARELGKPVIAVKVGRSEQGARAVASHTGAITGSDAAYDAAFDAAGILRVAGMEDLLDAARIFAPGRRCAGDRLTVLSMSGGVGILMSDLAPEAGLRAASWDATWRARMADAIPDYGSPDHPIDMTAQLNTDPRILARALRVAAEHPGTDVIAVFLGVVAGGAQPLVDVLVEVAATTDKPIAVAWTGGDGTPLRALNTARIPAFADANRAITALGLLARHATRPVADPPHPPDPRPAEHARRILSAAPGARLDEVDSKRLLAAYGIDCVPERAAGTPDEAGAAATELGFPVAVKLLSTEVAHKSEMRAVHLGLDDAGQVTDAAAAVLDAARTAGVGDARILVQSMAGPGVELLAGTTVDPVFGPLVVAGTGGVLVEVLHDTATALAPVGPGTARRLLEERRGAALLHGVRGAPPVDVDAAAHVVARLSRLAADLSEEIREIDVNPLIVGPGGALVVDALVVRARSE